MNSRSKSKKSNVEKSTTNVKESTKRTMPAIEPTTTKKQKLTENSLAKTGWKHLEELGNFTYLESSFDKPEYVFVNKVQILNHLDEGYGLYAANNIPAKTLIGEYTGKILANTNTNSHYSMEISKNVICDAKEHGNFTRFSNYSEHQDNIEFVKIDKNKRTLVAVYTKRVINQNEQLLVNYNTFNEEASKYLFLNSDDSWESSIEYYNRHQSKFTLSVMNNSFPGLNIQKDDEIYLTKIATTIINNESLALIKRPELTTINFRILKACNADETPMEFNEFDTINALMVACYLGQIDNVNWLLENGAEINKQQTISGRSALFFAIQGVKDGFCTENDCLTIIATLIKHKAKVYIQDNLSELFIFSAIRYTSSNTIEKIINELLINKNTFKKVSSYVNEDYEDIFYVAIKHKRVDTLKILLSHSPTYINDYIGEDNYYSYDDMKTAISNYSQDEIVQLKTIFNKFNRDANLIQVIFTDKTKDSYTKKLRSHNTISGVNSSPKNQSIKLFDHKPYKCKKICLPENSPKECKRDIHTRKNKK